LSTNDRNPHEGLFAFPFFTTLASYHHNNSQMAISQERKKKTRKKGDEKLKENERKLCGKVKLIVLHVVR
jgi:hypothetical protein